MRTLQCAVCASSLGLSEHYLRDHEGVICKECIFREDERTCTYCGESLNEGEGIEGLDATTALCRAGDQCPLGDMLSSGTCCRDCWRDALARVPGCDGAGRHGSILSGCGHTVCAAMVVSIGDDNDEENDPEPRPRDPSALAHFWSERCPDCRRADYRTKKLDLELKFAAQDEPLMKHIVRVARSDLVRNTARQWLLGREKYAAPAYAPPVTGCYLERDSSELDTPPRKSRRLFDR